MERVKLAVVVLPFPKVFYEMPVGLRMIKILGKSQKFFMYRRCSISRFGVFFRGFVRGGCWF